MIFVKKPIFLLKRYFTNAESYSTPRFIIELTVFSLVSKFALGLILIITLLIILVPFFILNPKFDDNSLDTLLKTQSIIKASQSNSPIKYIAIFFATTIGPIFETLTTQMLPIWIASFFTKNIKWLLVISAVIFSFSHIDPFLIFVTFPIGLILAWSYIVMRKRSRWKAFYTTTAIHLLFNAFTLLTNAIFKF